MAYAIGDTTYHNGRKITITTEPYSQFGAQYQDGVMDDGVTVLSVATPEERERTVKRNQAEYASQQEQFRRLK